MIVDKLRNAVGLRSRQIFGDGYEGYKQRLWIELGEMDEAYPPVS